MASKAGGTRVPTWALATAIGLLVAGCASVTLAPPAEDSAAKRFEVPAGKALIYVYRDTNFGAAVKFDIGVNGSAVGQSARYTYFLIETQPGTVKLKAESENTSELAVNAEAGKIYWVSQGVRLGFIMARVSLELASEADGRKGVGESQLVKRVQL